MCIRDRILIVEDEEAIADLERDYLELSGFTVEVANDGDTGLQKALNEDYDLSLIHISSIHRDHECMAGNGISDDYLPGRNPGNQSGTL